MLLLYSQVRLINKNKYEIKYKHNSIIIMPLAFLYSMEYKNYLVYF